MRRYPRVRRYGIVHRRTGYSVLAYDARGRVVNLLNGGHGLAELKGLVRAARKHWPDAKLRVRVHHRRTR